MLNGMDDTCCRDCLAQVGQLRLLEALRALLGPVMRQYYA